MGGIPAYPSLGDVPHVPDLVVLAVNREIADGVMAEAAGMGAGAGILLGAGFGEVDGRGQELNELVRSWSRPLP